MRISEIDKNLNIESNLTNESLIWLDCKDSPFDLTGLAGYDGRFTRLPENLLPNVRKELAWLSRHTSGGRVRFRTNSSCVALNAVLPSIDMMPHMPLTGSSGFDLFAGDSLAMFVTPPDIKTTSFEKLCYLTSPADSDGFRDIVINFPLYNSVKSLSIGLEKDSIILPPKATKYGKVVFYGSSITQGGVASRPGNNYANLLAKWLDFELVNLGFSGNAFGDTVIADYIASIPMSAFVMDYDFNARSLEELKSTHETLFKKVRQAQPNIPIIIVSNPIASLATRAKGNDPRFEIITKTYNNAIENGDKKVWLVDGATLLGKQNRDACTVDNLHPNDLGFYRMAQTIKPVLEKSLQSK